MCFLPCASRQGAALWPPAGDHEGRPYGAFAPIRKDWEARMAYHILLVDDAPERGAWWESCWRGRAMLSHWRPTAPGPPGVDESQPDAALLDVMLPDGDGFSLLEELRRVGNGVPVLFLSARDEDEARLRGAGPGGGRLHHQALPASGAALCAWRRCSAGCTALGRGGAAPRGGGGALGHRHGAPPRRR